MCVYVLHPHDPVSQWTVHVLLSFRRYYTRRDEHQNGQCGAGFYGVVVVVMLYRQSNVRAAVDLVGDRLLPESGGITYTGREICTKQYTQDHHSSRRGRLDGSIWSRLSLLLPLWRSPSRRTLSAMSSSWTLTELLLATEWVSACRRRSRSCSCW